METSKYTSKPKGPTDSCLNSQAEEKKKESKTTTKNPPKTIILILPARFQGSFESVRTFCIFQQY